MAMFVPPWLVLQGGYGIDQGAGCSEFRHVNVRRWRETTILRASPSALAMPASSSPGVASTATPIPSLKYGKCQSCGFSTTPSSEMNSPAVTFLVLCLP